ncbi:MAG: type II toxin-antitoxin system HicB family antitoxin [bacterium]
MNDKQNITFPVIVELDEDNIFIVSCPVFKGCHSYGKTIDEAMSNLVEVIEMCIEEEPYNFDKSNKYIGIREINFTKTGINKLQYA